MTGALPEYLRTARLTLRGWKDSDLETFYAMNTDPVVMEYFPRMFDKHQSLTMVENIQKHFHENGFGMWAVELAPTQEFIGYVGLVRAKFEAPFTPCVEVGWRLAKEHWGKGYATEGAEACLRDGFERVELDEIVSFTAAINQRSIRVMEKLKMTSNPSENFSHPMVPSESELCEHVLYRLSKHAWQTTRSSAACAHKN